MKVKTSTLKGRQLDWAVAKGGATAVGANLKMETFLHFHEIEFMTYSEDFALGAPILSRERISRTIDHSGLWVAYWSDGYTEGDEGKQHMQCDKSELVAGLRCVVARKLGDEVEIPEELL
jgi:hypothetical protein